MYNRADVRQLEYAFGTLDTRMAGQMDEGQKKDMVDQLYGILNRIEQIDLNDIPDELSRSTYRLFPQPINLSHQRIVNALGDPQPPAIELSVDNFGNWRFSADTLDNVSALYDRMVHLPLVAGELTWIERFERQLPSELRARYLTLKGWQWLAILFVIFVGVILDFTVRILVRGFVMRQLDRGIKGEKVTEERKKLIDRAMKPLGLLAASLFWLGTINYLGLIGLSFIIIQGGLTVFAVLVSVLAAWRLIDVVTEVAMERAASTETKLDDVVVPLLRKTVKIFVLVMGVIYGANVLDIPILPLLTSLGIGGVAFAFAAKDTVENLFGSVAVLLDRPFDVGDWVVVDGHEGTVEAVGFRSTRIRTFYNSQITVPNSNLVRAVVDNYGRRKYRRWRCHIGVQYDTTPDQLVSFTEGIRELVRTHPFTRKDYFQVWVHEFADASINILIYVFHEVPDWSTELRERERLMLDMMRLADSLGVQFAFPTQTIHLFNEEHKPYEQQHEQPKSMTDRRSMIQGIRAAQHLTANQPWQNEKPGPVQYPIGPTALDQLDPNQTIDPEQAKYEVTENTPSNTSVSDTPEAEQPPQT